MRRSMTAIAAMMVRRGDADAMLCGLVGRYGNHLQRVADVIGLAPGARTFATVNALMLPEHTLFIADTFVNEDPSAEELGEIALLAAGEVRRRLPLEAGGMRGAANLLVMPNLDAANILSNVLKMTGGKGITVGPMLLGAAEAVHILEPSCTVRRVVNMTALASADVRDAGRQAGADPV
jgi:malate dehydrogenase (oxaloacetate-decarboxylating)(NADP+)